MDCAVVGRHIRWRCDAIALLGFSASIGWVVYVVGDKGPWLGEVGQARATHCNGVARIEVLRVAGQPANQDHVVTA